MYYEFNKILGYLFYSAYSLHQFWSFVASIAQLVEALDKMNAPMVRVTPAAGRKNDIGVVSLGKRRHTTFHVLSETDVN